jgi:hypothetical protein
MRADPTQYPREGKLSFDNLQSILIFPLRSEGDITLNVHTSRTYHHTGRPLRLLDGIDIGNRLRIGNVCSLPLGQTLLIFTGQFNRTNPRTFSTTGALQRVDISGALLHPYPVATRFPFHVKKLGIRQDLYIEMATKLNELGRKDSHGTIVSGEGLIQLSHDSPDARSLLYHIDEITRFGQIERGLNPGNASSYHHDSANLVILCRQCNPIHKFSYHTAPSPPPSPQRGEGKGEGKFQIFLATISVPPKAGI